MVFFHAEKNIFTDVLLICTDQTQKTMMSSSAAMLSFCALIRGWTLNWSTDWCCSSTGSTPRYSVTTKPARSLYTLLGTSKHPQIFALEIQNTIHSHIFIFCFTPSLQGVFVAKMPNLCFICLICNIKYFRVKKKTLKVKYFSWHFNLTKCLACI